MSGSYILWWCIVGLIAGVLASLVVGGIGYGILGDIVVGIVGAFIGGWLFSALGVWRPSRDTRTVCRRRERRAHSRASMRTRCATGIARVCSKGQA